MYPSPSQQTRAEYLCGQFGLTYDKTTDLVNILDIDRSKISWIKSVYDQQMSGQQCLKCGTTAGPFELDHMSPWRPYVIAFLGPDEAKESGGRLLVSRSIVRALYNDPENLWCLCRSCNRAKSDKVYTIQQAIAISQGKEPSGAMARVRDKKELAALWE